MSSPVTALLLPALAVVLVGWRLHRRFQRLVTRQRLRSGRAWASALLFPLLVLLLLLPASASTAAAGALVGGALAGGALGVYGLRSTRFEPTPDGLFYTPSKHLGIGLSLLLAARIAYRLLQARLAGYAALQQQPATGSPLTLGIFGLFAGYYAVYAIGLLRWQRQVRRTGPLAA